jgi:hypothetical protein
MSLQGTGIGMLPGGAWRAAQSAWSKLGWGARVLGGVETIGAVTSRALTPADLGLPQGALTQLEGSYSVMNGVATVRIDMIAGKIANPFGVVDNLARTAQADGAATLNIKGTIVNERLYDALSRRYGMTSQGATDTISVPLGN